MFKKGDRVWMRDHPKLGWAPACVVAINSQTNTPFLTIKSISDDLEHVVDARAVSRIGEESLADYQDMVTIDDLNEGVMLHNLCRRFDKGNIYTWIGSVLVAVNPVRAMPHLYGSDMISAASAAAASDKMPTPHIYVLAARAYRAATRSVAPQMFLVSGESGAGKTESCRLILQYLVQASGSQGSMAHAINKIILESAPILESFGNARTIKNNNSSRFGKFLKIFFDTDGKMCGAQISQFLLEKARVVKQAAGERNYGIFYMLVEGCTHEQRRRLGLGPGVHNYKILGSVPSQPLEQAEDVANFTKLMQALKVLSMSETDIHQIFEILAAVLHLGNVEFGKYDHGGCVVLDNRPLSAAALLLGVDPKSLEMALVSQIVTAGKRGSSARKLLDPAASNQARDALVKALYGGLFEWLCTTLNSKLATSAALDERRTIGILDIFGFECMETNRFEQLLINYANEVFQLQYAKQLFVTEQQEYEKEQLPWKRVECAHISHDPCVDLLDKKPKGILTTLEEECMLPKGGDANFLLRMHTTHDKHNYYIRPKLDPKAFGIRHFAGDVVYDTTGFVEANRDEIHTDIVNMLCYSAKDIVKHLAMKMANQKRGTVSGQFRTALASLLKDMAQVQLNGNIHYVRCIKPHATKGLSKFDPRFVLHQMRCIGLLETVRVRKGGYALRLPFDQFCQRYNCLTAGANVAPPSRLDFRSQCSIFLKQILPPQSHETTPLYQMGLTKVFLKDKLIATLEEMRFKEEKKREEEERKKREEQERLRKIEEEERLRKIEIENARKAEEEKVKRAEVERLKKIEEQEKLKKAEIEKEGLKRIEEQEKLRKMEELKKKEKELEDIKMKEKQAEAKQAEAKQTEANQTEEAEVEELKIEVKVGGGAEIKNEKADPANRPKPKRLSYKDVLVLGPKQPTIATAVAGTAAAVVGVAVTVAAAQPDTSGSNAAIRKISSTQEERLKNNKAAVVAQPEPATVAVAPDLTNANTLDIELLENVAFQQAFLDFFALLCVGLGELWRDIQAYKKASERVMPNMGRSIYAKYFNSADTKLKYQRLHELLDRKIAADVREKVQYRNPDKQTFSRLERDTVCVMQNSFLQKFIESGKGPTVFIKKMGPEVPDKRVSTFMAAKAGGGSVKEVSKLARVTIGRSASEVSVNSPPNNPLYLQPPVLASASAPARPNIPSVYMPVDKGVAAFNDSPKKGIDYLVETKELERHPSKVAEYLKTKKGLDKNKIGEYIGGRDEFNCEVLDHFACSISFEAMEFDLAVRHFLSFFRLPGESQMIERIMQKFSSKYHYDNQGLVNFADADAAFVLSYSVIMLATDLHNKNVKVKMTFQQWVKNNAGCNGGKNFEEQYLRGIYDRISKAPLKTDADTGPTTPTTPSTQRKPLLSFASPTLPSASSPPPTASSSNPKKFSVLLRKK